MAPISYASCPSAVINAPVSVVWTLLTEPAAWGDFFDLRINSVQPPGPAMVGQRICGETGLRFLHLSVTFEITQVDSARNRLGVDIQLPFGLTNREDLDCIPLGTQCRVNYHCNFGFPREWRGALLRAVLRRSLDTGPADSLSRLKRVAERRYVSSQG